MSIRLTEQDEATIREKVETGRYRDAEEVVHTALRLLDNLEGEIAWLNVELQRGIDQLDRGERVELTPELIEDMKRNARQTAGTNRRYKDAILP